MPDTEKPAGAGFSGDARSMAYWFSAKKNQVSSTESGLSDTVSMPSSISQRARSGWSDGP